MTRQNVCGLEVRKDPAQDARLLHHVLLPRRRTCEVHRCGTHRRTRLIEQACRAPPDIDRRRRRRRRLVWLVRRWGATLPSELVGAPSAHRPAVVPGAAMAVRTCTKHTCKVAWQAAPPELQECFTGADGRNAAERAGGLEAVVIALMVAGAGEILPLLCMCAL